MATVCSSTGWKEEPSWSLSGHEPGRWASSSSSSGCCPPRTRQGSGAAVRAAWQTPALAARPQGCGVRLVSLRHFSEELPCAMCPSVAWQPQKGGGRENARSPGASAKIGMLFSTVTSRPEGVSPFGLMCSSDPPTSAGRKHSQFGGGQGLTLLRVWGAPRANIPPLSLEKIGRMERASHGRKEKPV